MPAVIVTTGDDRAARYLSAVGNAAMHLRKPMEQAANRTARRVTGVPQDTGRLARSIEPLWVNDEGFGVGSKVPYAGYVFQGTKYMRPRPPDVPADVGQRTAVLIARHLKRPR